MRLASAARLKCKSIEVKLATRVQDIMVMSDVQALPTLHHQLHYLAFVPSKELMDSKHSWIHRLHSGSLQAGVAWSSPCGLTSADVVVVCCLPGLIEQLLPVCTRWRHQGVIKEAEMLSRHGWRARNQYACVLTWWQRRRSDDTHLVHWRWRRWRLSLELELEHETRAHSE